MKRTFLLIFLALAGPASAQSADLVVGGFSAGRLEGWSPEEFEGETHYELVRDDGQQVLRAVSEGTASGLVKKQRIDLRERPYLNWRWKVESRLPARDERTRAGDDYAARVYLVVSGGLRFWRTKALNYVWAGSMEKGATWSNAFAPDNVVMLALRNDSDEAGQWHREKRNVLEDLQRLVDPDVRYVDAIAIMTDSDNTGASAISYYGDIYFSAQ